MHEKKRGRRGVMSGPVELVGLGLGLVRCLVGCPGDDGAARAADGGDGAGGGEFSVLSYNVAGLPQEFSGEQPSVHLPLISPLLNAYDIVLTQEDFDWWVPGLDGFDFVHYHERLRKDATHEYRSEKHPGPEAVGIDLDLRPEPQVGDGLGFLSRFAFTDVTRVPWARCFGGIDGSDRGAGDCLAMKGFMVGTFELAPGREVDIYTLHAEAGATETDQELQADDMKALAQLIAERSEGRALIVAGDTNLHTAGDHPDATGALDGEIWSTFLEATELSDACAELDCTEPGSIDKLAFRSGQGVQLTALSHHFEVERFQNAQGEPLSDHDALKVEFRWDPRD